MTSAPEPTGSPASRTALGAALVVVIDGPSGTGKSSVSRAVARDLALGYLDTGAMYRAVAYWCRERGIPLDDADAVAAAARDLPLEIGTDPAAPRFVLAGEEVGAALHASDVSTIVSKVATNLAVRGALIARQRALIEAASHGAGIVAEGRDLTTVVAPDAPVRILLSASEEARLARRAAQTHGVVDAATVEATRDEVLRRDRDDSTVADFVTAADGVVGLDTSDLTFAQTVTAVRELALRARRP